MSARQKLSTEEMRERIIIVAEEHFRRIGYGKTAVADIAAAMGMSPANIYRFFPSKSAINDAICARMMREIDDILRAIATREAPAGKRLSALFLDLHRHNKSKLTDEHRLHDMVEVAMAENWPAIGAHCHAVIGFIAGILRDGVASGEFRSVDIEEMAQTLFDMGAKVFHPTLIAHCAGQDQEAQAKRLVALALAALRATPSTQTHII